MNTVVPLAVQDLRARIEAIRTPCGHGQGSFIPKELLHRYLSRRNLLKLLSALHIPAGCLDSIENNLLRVFVILIQIERASSISSFVESSDVKDSNLPFHEKDISKWPEDCRDFFDEFYNRQWEYCVKKWGIKGEDKLTGFKLPEEALLPIVNETVLRNGSNSRTLKIDLHPDYNGLRQDTNEFVLKICSLRQETHYKKELETYQMLTQQEGAASNIVCLYGHFRYRNDRHLVLEHVDGGTLEALFQSSPPTLDQVPAFWASFLSIFTPLYKLHDLRFQGYQYQAIHQDFKPSNIMIARPSQFSYDSTTFKLIDFAFSQFRKLDTNGRATVLDEGGTQLFSAPEIYRMDRVQQSVNISIDVSVDTWSFGAVLSETLIWCTLGKHGFEKYRSRRRKATEGTSLENGGYGGCFHDGERVLDVVSDMHDEALESAKGNVYVYGLLTAIRTLIESILDAEVPKSRPDDHTLYRRCQKIIAQAKKLAIAQRDAQNGLQEERATESDLALIQPPPRISPPPEDLLEYDDIKRPRAYSASTFDARSPPSESGFSQNVGDYTPSIRPSIPPETLGNGHLGNGTPTKHQLKPADDQNVNGQRDKQSTSDISKLGIQAVHSWITRKQDKFRNPLTGTTIESEKIEGSEQLHKIMGRDQIFLFDDSYSMKGTWLGPGGVKQTFEALGYMVKRCTPHKMEAYLTCEKASKESRNRSDILTLLDKPRFSEECNMNYWIRRAVEKWKTKSRVFDEGVNKSGRWLSPKHGKEPGLDLYIFTAGIWQEVPGSSHLCGVDKVIRDLIEDMVYKNVPARTIRIRFIRFDKIQVGVERLEKLIEKFHSTDIPQDYWKVIDVETHDGDVWKMLLG